MAEFVSGSTMVLNWIYNGGTLVLAADYREASWTPSVDFVDGSAGSDTVKQRQTTMKDATADITLVNATGGTLLYAKLDAGVGGTLIIQPEGTAVGKRKITFPAFSQGAKYVHPYAEIATLTCSFIANGAYTEGSN